MRLKCQYCRLTLDQQHFILADKQLTSICDICQVRGLQLGDFENTQTRALATVRQWVYLGLPTGAPQQSKQRLSLNKSQKKRCASLIDAFDALTGSWQNTKMRRDFYRRIIAWQDQPAATVITGNLPNDLAKLGFDVDRLFDKNTLDYTTRAYIREKFHHQCQYCGRYGDSVDHKDPVTLSDDNRLENLTLACRECNKLKGSMPYQQFWQWNQEIPATLAQLRDYEKTLQRLNVQQKTYQNRLAVQRHLNAEIRDPQLVALRKQIKLFQGLIDGEDSDYQKLIQTRHDYIISHYETWQLEQKE